MWRGETPRIRGMARYGGWRLSGAGWVCPTTFRLKTIAVFADSW